jgi:glutathione peroxidase
LTLLLSGLLLVSGCGDCHTCGQNGNDLQPPESETTELLAGGACSSNGTCSSDVTCSVDASCGEGGACCQNASRAGLLAAKAQCLAGADLVAAAPEATAATEADEQGKGEKAVADKGELKVPGVLDFKVETLNGKPLELAKYQGKAILFVNVASQCGYTPQYAGLQKLHEKYGPQGLTVIGVPANNFGSQEPGSNDEIAQFCKKNYGVTFDMLSKVSVKGSDKCPLYVYLTSKETNPNHAGEVKWNFEKFLIGRNGEVVGRFDSKVKPDSPELTKAIEAALEKQ